MSSKLKTIQNNNDDIPSNWSSVNTSAYLIKKEIYDKLQTCTKKISSDTHTITSFVDSRITWLTG